MPRDLSWNELSRFRLTGEYPADYKPDVVLDSVDDCIQPTEVVPEVVEVIEVIEAVEAPKSKSKSKRVED